MAIASPRVSSLVVGTWWRRRRGTPGWTVGVPRQEFSAGEVGMDNPISYNGVLLKDKLTTITFASSEHPHALPFGLSSIAIGFQRMGRWWTWWAKSSVGVRWLISAQTLEFEGEFDWSGIRSRLSNGNCRADDCPMEGRVCCWMDVAETSRWLLNRPSTALGKCRALTEQCANRSCARYWEKKNMEKCVQRPWGIGWTFKIGSNMYSLGRE